MPIRIVFTNRRIHPRVREYFFHHENRIHHRCTPPDILQEAVRGKSQPSQPQIIQDILPIRSGSPASQLARISHRRGLNGLDSQRGDDRRSYVRGRQKYVWGTDVNVHVHASAYVKRRRQRLPSWNAEYAIAEGQQTGKLAAGMDSPLPVGLRVSGMLGCKGCSGLLTVVGADRATRRGR